MPLLRNKLSLNKPLALVILYVCVSSPTFAAGDDLFVITPDEVIGLKQKSKKPAKPSIFAPEAFTPPTKAPSDIRDLIQTQSLRFGIDHRFVNAIIQEESAFNSSAVSPKGAIGLMQVMPLTGKRFGVTKLTDPYENLQAGLQYLLFLNTLFAGDATLIVASYNAGEGAVARYGNKVPPYAETQRYVKRVLARYFASLSQDGEI